MSVQGICSVDVIDDPIEGKPFLRLKFDHVTIDITTNLAEMIGGIGAGVRKREEDKGK